MKRALIYSRVSDLRQVQGTSLEVQEEVCRQWAEDHGFTLDRLFVERGRSAKTEHRPKFLEMISYVESKPKAYFSAVVVHSRDRLSRDMDVSAEFRIRLRRCGVQVFGTAERPEDADSDGTFIRVRMDEMFAELDNRKRSQRAKAGMTHRIREGRVVWPAALGYRNGGKGNPSLVQDERAPLIRQLFQSVAAGTKKLDALRQVTALGLRTKIGRQVGQQTLRKLLVNPVYRGEILAKKWHIVSQGDFQPIVDAETFDKLS